MIKKISLLILSCLCAINITAVNAVSIADFEGEYWLEDETSILKGYQIEDGLFSVIVNPGVVAEEGKEDLPGQAIFFWTNTMRNHHSLFGQVSTDESSNQEADNAPLLLIEPYNGDFGMPFPHFQFSIYRPNYLFEDDSLVIKYGSERPHQFTVNEDGNLVDQNGVVFIKK